MRAINCAAFRPAVIKTVDCGSNSAAKRNRLLFSGAAQALVGTDQDDSASYGLHALRAGDG